MESARTTVGKAIQQFLRSLRERNVSPHTIKAYSGDLANFCSYIGSRKWREIDHVAIRGFLSHLYEKGLGKTSVARSLAAADRGRVEVASFTQLPSRHPVSAATHSPRPSTR